MAALSPTRRLFSSATLTNTVFAVDANGPPETLVAARRAKKGTAFRYSLSEPARVVFTIERVLAGRKVRSKCRKPSRANRRKRACKRYKRRGRFAQQAVAGANSKAWSGKLGKRKPPPGSYRATLVGSYATGPPLAAKAVTFKIVRR